MRRGTRSPLQFRKYAFSNFDRCDYAGCIYFAVTSILPKYHAPLRLATADILLSPVYAGKLYGAEDVASYTINDMTDVTNNPSMFTKVDVTALIHAFANENEDHFVMLYVRRETRRGRHDRSSKYSLLLIRCFSSMEARWGAHVVLLRVTMEDNVHDGLVCYLSRSKKRSAAAISRPAKSRWSSSIHHRRTNPSW